jgi:glycosyltransferase involved in cell wall biosynthesis
MLENEIRRITQSVTERSDAKQLLSVVIPVFNESKNIERLINRLLAVFAGLEDKYDFELVFTDNHSTDDTYEALEAWSNKLPNMRVLRFSKNIGYQRSILAGYLSARGDAVIQIDADLQDPPEKIQEFISQWESGYQVVYGVRTSRTDGVGSRLTRGMFYRILNAFSRDNLPLDAGEFRLIDRQVIDELRHVNDVRPYLRGAIASMGFKQIGIPYERGEREIGESKFNSKDLVRLALDGFFNHSTLPLRIATFIGLMVSVGTLVTGIGFFVGKLFFQQSWPRGFATTTILILMSLSILSLLLGVIGEYLSRIYEQVRYSPKVMVEKEIDSDR